MSFVVVTPEALAAAASQLENIGSALSEAHAATAPAITRVIAAAEDEVSAAIASVFSEYAQNYQLLRVQATEFHAQFVHATKSALRQYQDAEAELYALLAARQADRAALSSPAPNPHDTSPAGGGG